jgi:thiol-disulfide isomerase/thioredoxin
VLFIILTIDVTFSSVIFLPIHLNFIFLSVLFTSCSTKRGSRLLVSFFSVVTLTTVDSILLQEVNKTDKKMKYKCIGRNITLENVTSIVKIINNTRLLQMLNFEKNDTLSDCVLVIFYAPWCRFCAKVAPSFNALARAFPDLDIVAVDAAHFSK